MKRLSTEKVESAFFVSYVPQSLLLLAVLVNGLFFGKINTFARKRFALNNSRFPPISVSETGTLEARVFTDSNDVSKAVKTSVDALRQGKLVVVPTETVYGIAALASNADAVARLFKCKGRPLNRPFALAVPNFSAVEQFAPNPPAMARNIARKLWPGPVTLILDATDPTSVLQRFPRETQLAIAPQGSVGFRCPQNDFLLDVLKALDEPIALTSANLSGGSDSVTINDAEASLGDRVDLFVDGGAAKLGEASTVARVQSDKITILRQGATPEEKLRIAAVKTILFVCSGNICRSPMAEGLAKRALAERLKTDVNGLESAGFWVLSAGLDAYHGDEAAEFAKEVLKRDYNVSLDNFRSRAVVPYLLDETDQIYVMTRSLLNVLTKKFPDAANRAQLLRTDGRDVDDPYGGDVEAFRDCARVINRHILARLDEMIES